jgi:hypothetical protein
VLPDRTVAEGTGGQVNFTTCFDGPILSRRAVNSIGSGAPYWPKTGRWTFEEAQDMPVK